ncbi:MAG: TIGR02757 family protein [Muribaculaceae bacterium]|nr:TIGR02757 family protein [Muribaculaceae bacterium]
MKQITDDIWQLLESEALRINSPAFIGADPVQFPRRYTALQDIEIASLLCATIAWGNRKMICRDCDRMLALMGHDPYRYVMDGAYEELPDGNVHRTFFTRNLRHFLRGLHRVYREFDSIADFAKARGVARAEAPAWELAALLNEELAAANSGAADSRCLPVNLRNTALKRLNMALRWLVRDDGIVDMGVWKGVLKPSQLYIPMDVHVNNTARELGLIERKSADRRAVTELTELLATRRPADPVWFDYALFGIGIGVDTEQNNFMD